MIANLLNSFDGSRICLAENEALDKLLIATVSKEPGKRDAVTEQLIRDHLTFIATERAKIQTALNERFPQFAALSKLIPISLKDTQGLLADDEALIVFDFDRQSYAWVITRTNADWTEIRLRQTT